MDTIRLIKIPARINGAQGIATHLIICNSNEQGLEFMKNNGYEFMPDMGFHCYMGYYFRLVSIDITITN